MSESTCNIFPRHGIKKLRIIRNTFIIRNLEIFAEWRDTTIRPPGSSVRLFNLLKAFSMAIDFAKNVDSIQHLQVAIFVGQSLRCNDSGLNGRRLVFSV